MKDLTDIDYKDLFRDAVNMMAHIARAAGFDPNDPTVEPPAIVARVENLRAEVERLTAERAAVRAALVDSGTEPVTEDMGKLAALVAAQLADEVATIARLDQEIGRLQSALGSEITARQASEAEVERLTAELEEARRGPGGVLAEVAAERARQIGKGYTAEHDDGAVMGELAQVAGLVLLRLNSHKVTLHEADEVAGYILGKYSDDRYRQLIIALAMGAAEAERLKRLATREASTPPTTP